jgi:hypothetical protein
MSKVYKTWQDFPLGDWPWPSFILLELANRREGELLIDEASMDKLQKLRNFFGEAAADHQRISLSSA